MSHDLILQIPPQTDTEKAYLVALETIREVSESRLMVGDSEDLLEFIKEVDKIHDVVFWQKFPIMMTYFYRL